MYASRAGGRAGGFAVCCLDPGRKGGLWMKRLRNSMRDYSRRGRESREYPNLDETLRWAKISPFLSKIASESSFPLRIFLMLGAGEDR